MSSIKKKNQFRGRRGGSIGKLPKEKPEFRGRREFRGRTVVEKKTEFKRQQGIRSDRFLTKAKNGNLLSQASSRPIRFHSQPSEHFFFFRADSMCWKYHRLYVQSWLTSQYSKSERRIVTVIGIFDYRIRWREKRHRQEKGNAPQ